MNKLEIISLHVKTDDKEILKGVNLTIRSGEMHAIMGPNGSGKSTLCHAIMGHPSYVITKGSVLFNGQDILKLDTNKRAQMGLFLGFQHPREVPGVTFGNFLRLIHNSIQKQYEPAKKTLSPGQFIPIAQKELAGMNFDKTFIGRSLNDGFSGGEKKRAEIVQMSILRPKFALLDEIDSGLDIDALKITAEGIRRIYEVEKTGMLLITHYQRILNYLEPDHVHVMAEGRIIVSGGKELAKKLEKEGYESIISQA